MADTGKVYAIDKARAMLDMTSDLPYTSIHQDSDITVGLYSPQQPDRQKPHTRDEYYFVASGSGNIEIDGVTYPLGTGDVAFVAARATHAFTETSEDFSCWVLFYGPEK